MNKILNIHEEVFNFLLAKHEQDPEFYFTLRRSNRYNRLNEGYWFHGNDDYLTISFWTGFDYANKTPNIGFVIHQDGSSKLELSAYDSSIKFEFIKRLVSRIEGFEQVGDWKFFKHFRGRNYFRSIEEFLVNEKKVIDDILKQSYPLFSEVKDEDQIALLTKRYFNFVLKRINEKRRELGAHLIRKLPISLDSLLAKNYGPIKSLTIEGLDPFSQFIFFTGENGSGKSSILRSIALSINNDHRRLFNNNDPGHYEINIVLNRGNTKVSRSFRALQAIEKTKLLVHGFACYGAHRLITSKIDDLNSERTDITYSLFNDDGLLLDIWNTIGVWRRRSASSQKFSKRLDSIRLTLHDLISNLRRIYFPGELNINDSLDETYYQEQDNIQQPFEFVRFNHLASGIRSVIAMFGDMMLRLFDQQPEAEEVADLKGIVLIDEIDIHLHPKLQKGIIENLSATFPNVQFVITTHSPVPLLGAPKNSQLFKVTREVTRGVCAQSLDFVEFNNLLPNALLTSPIFDLQTIRPFGNTDVKDLKVEDHFDETLFYNIVEQQIEKMFRENKKEQ